jgi:2-polyprenyl-3-methyl-5-hydroxy-6-metoxy-1,4-benzoquinol methylase
VPPRAERIAMAQRPAAYDEDLAYIHDVGYDFHAQGLAPHLLRLFQGVPAEGGPVVDLGCGSGIWALRLHKAGFRVQTLRRFGDYELLSGRVGFVARKA